MENNRITFICFVKQGVKIQPNLDYFTEKKVILQYLVDKLGRDKSTVARLPTINGEVNFFNPLSSPLADLMRRQKNKQTDLMSLYFF